MLRHRIISLVALVLLLLSATTFYAAQSAQRLQQRGTITDTPSGFPPPVRGAESLRLGVNVALEQYDTVTLDQRLADLARRGVRYVRQEFHWADLEPSQGQFDWALSDRIFAAARQHDIQVLAVLVTTPQWARAPSGSVAYPPTETMPPREAQDFARFAGAFAQRYDGTTADGSRQTEAVSSAVRRPPSILAYQIWDEPNLSAKWGDGLISPVRYLQLLQTARQAIHEVNPNALIVLAGLAPTVEQTDVNLSAHLYLRKLYEAGGRDAFDIVATKPYGFDYPPDDRRVSLELLNFSRAILLREEMVAHGDTDKAVWLTQWGWHAQLPNWTGEPSIWSGVSEELQARYTLDSVRRVAAEWQWAGAMFLYTLQPDASPDDALWGFSMLDQEGHPRPVYDAFTAALDDARRAPRAQWSAQAVAASSESGGQVSYRPNPLATFSEGWRFGELGADIPRRDDARATFRFSGDALAMIVRRDDYRAYMFITVDGKPANLLPTEGRGAYLIMTSPDRLPRVDTIAVADGLGPGEHVAEVTIDRGWNQWALIGWSSRTTASADAGQTALAMPIAVVVLLLSAGALLVSLPRAYWGDVLRRQRAFTLPAWQSMIAALLVWLTASLTWAQDAATAYHNLGTPAHVVLTGFVSGVAFWSPVYVVSLLALAVLFVLVLARLDIGLALLAFFIPFYLIPQRIFAHSFPMVELLTLMCAASWGLRKIRDWRLEIGDRRKSPISSLQSLISNLSLLDWGILALVMVATLSALQADFKVEAVRELRLVFIEPAILYLMLRTLKLDAEQTWRIADGFVLGAVAIACIGLLNYAQGNVFPAELGFPRIRSVYGSPNNDALYLGRAFPLLLAVVLFGVGDWRVGAERGDSAGGGEATRRLLNRLINRRSLYAIGLAIVSVALVLSASRGALLFGMPAAVIVVCLLGGGRWRYVGIGMLLLLVLAFVVLISGAATSLLAGTRLANALDVTRGTGFFRMNLWQSALTMWHDHPILGVGPDNFLYAYRGYYILPAAWQEPNLSHPHNIVLDFATRLGTLGLLAGGVVALGVIQSLRHALTGTTRSVLRPLAVGLAGLFVYVFAHGLVDHSLFLLDLAFVFMLACGLLSVLKSASYGGRVLK